MSSHVPEFGLNVADVEYRLRPGGYAVIFSNDGEVAVVSTPKGLFLPGGGQCAAESAEKAAAREALEECGLRISIGASIGVADELVFAVEEGKHYRKRCAFFLAEITERLAAGEPDHELIWIAPEAAVTGLLHESQRWAVDAACRLTNIKLPGSHQ